MQATDFVATLFERHGLACRIEDEWVLPDGRFPAVRALWEPGETHGRLDIHVLLDENGTTIEESFAGLGTGEDGLKDALANFTLNSFHVLLAALWDHNDPDQVTTERWTIAGKPYEACVGNFGTRASDGVTPRVPHDLFARLEAAVRGERLDRDFHWFCFFMASVSDEHTFEALKDNEAWESGLRCLEGTAWAPSEGYYSIRMFMMLRAAAR